MASHIGRTQKAKVKGSGSGRTISCELPSDENLFNDETMTAKSSRGKKRLKVDNEDDDEIIQGGDFMTMFDRFGADISKAFQTRQKRLETLTKSSLKNSQQKIEQLWKSQQLDRCKVTDDYSSQFKTVLHQWDTDLAKSKDQEEELLKMFQHQQRMFQQMKASQGHRLRGLKQLLEQYVQSLEVLEKSHVNQHEVLQNDLRQEMAMFQKKMLMETQQQEMASVRKSLQSMLM